MAEKIWQLDGRYIELHRRFENVLLSLAYTDGWAFTELTVPINPIAHER